jgi:RsmE family RNA methyltransferase
MHFFKAKQSEPSYAKSRLWQTDEWRKRIILGVEQAFCTHLPRVEVHSDMQSALAAPQGAFAKIALDNYEASSSLGTVPIASSSSVAIAVGPERGWSAAERSLLRENGWQLAHLGPRVLRTETACVAAIASVASRLSVWKNQTGSSL